MPVTIEHIEEIYYQFRKAQSDYNNRGFRLPKDFEDHFNIKFKEANKKALIKISGWFLTKWGNINPYDYFLCGFELYKKGFTYTKFFDEKILLLYKARDKNKKREIEITKKSLIKSALFVKKWMTENNASLYDYINTREGNHRLAVEHYLKNKIDASFIVFLIRKGMILTDNDRALIPYVQENFRNIKYELDGMKIFVRKMEEKL